MILLDFSPSDHTPAPPAPVVRPRPDERPRPERDLPAEALAKAAVSAAIAAKDGLDADLFSGVRVGLMLSSGRPGVKRLIFVLTDRIRPKRQLECSLVTGVRENHLVLTSDCRGREVEVARAEMNDPKAAGALGASVGRFVLETVEQFAKAGGQQ